MRAVAAGAARRAKVSEQSVGNWKRWVLEAGKTSLVAGKAGPSTREAQLEAEVEDLGHGTPGRANAQETRYPHGYLGKGPLTEP